MTQIFQRNWNTRLAIAAALTLLCCLPAFGQVQAVRSFALNKYLPYLDGQWQGIRYASDGNVYFASSTHSAHHGPAFFKYSAATREVTMLSDDLTKVCGEDPSTNPQGKLHSDIVEANGWLYMATNFSSELPGAYDKWTGSHVIGYQLSTGKFRDYGVVHPNYTSYSAIGVDPARNYIYVFVTGEAKGQVSYLYRIDAKSGAKKNLGQVGGQFGTSFWTFVDGRGDVWFTVASQHGDLKVVRGKTGEIETLPNVLPPLYLWEKNEVDPDPRHQDTRWILWMQPLDRDRAVFTLGFNGGMLYEFDSTKPIASAFKKIRHIGYSDLGLAVGENRVYYYQRANRAFGHQGDEAPGNLKDFHLLSVSLSAADQYAITDYGLIKDQDGRTVWRVPGMMTDGKNRVFMIGDWWTNPGDPGTKRYQYSKGVEDYVQLPRGEFFAVADTSATAIGVAHSGQ
jgi:hypothetical protein